MFVIVNDTCIWKEGGMSGSLGRDSKQNNPGRGCFVGEVRLMNR